MKTLVTSLIIICTIYSSGCTALENQPPNVIIVLTDDQGYGEVGALGNKSIHTPQMDALYHEGIRLTDFHVNNVCSPSRAAIMTGKYSTSVGVWHTLGGKNILHIEEKTMADIFRENSYKTYMVGKWHLGDNYPYRPEDRGFDKVFRIGGGSLGQVADYWENGLWDGHYWNGRDWIQTEGYCTDVQFEAAKNFIDKAGDDPFFLYLATTAPHAPIGAAPEYVEPYLEMGFSKEVSNFYGMVSNIDENLGRLRSFLKEKGMDRNTLLIFLSDNGSACAKKDSTIYNAGMRGKKGSDYEGGHRVPCFFYWPEGKVSGGRSVTQLTAHIDLLPTLVEACGLTLPENSRFDGINILPMLQENLSEWPGRVLVTEGKVNNREKLFSSSCVMSERWRLVSGTGLYDIETDPGQRQILNNPEKTEEMRQLYMNWHGGVSEAFDDEYWFLYSDEHSSTPFVTMDLLPVGINEKPKSVWNQSAVKKGIPDRGVWNIEFQGEGTYTFHLCRLPLEAEKVNNEKGNIREVQITGASLEIDGEQVATSKTIKNGQVKLKAEVTKGRHRISANFRNEDTGNFSTYYLYISRE
ncbi:MAG: arylsulfatase [Bacteroidetes bacterium]|nr:arylsulfatase [Bacteroidota bacterium]